MRWKAQLLEPQSASNTRFRIVSCCVMKSLRKYSQVILLTSVGLSVGPSLGFIVGAVVVGESETGFKVGT